MQTNIEQLTDKKKVNLQTTDNLKDKHTYKCTDKNMDNLQTNIKIILQKTFI